MESRERAAGDGDEEEREQGAREDGPVVAAGEFAEGRDGDFRADHDDGQGQHHDDADLHEGGEVVTRRQEQPDRQDGGDEAVDDDGPRRG